MRWPATTSSSRPVCSDMRTCAALLWREAAARANSGKPLFVSAHYLTSKRHDMHETEAHIDLTQHSRNNETEITLSLKRFSFVCKHTPQERKWTAPARAPR